MEKTKMFEVEVYRFAFPLDYKESLKLLNAEFALKKKEAISELRTIFKDIKSGKIKINTL
jgi:hypothetical protein